ncbi:MAG: hypothetical protein U0L52_03040, partial [Bacteroidaceae bacterium]|nr:hypothetical protein [Bacteroidaceae bacterium]
VVPLLSSSYYFKLCENLTSEDNFNNTFFGKVLPHTTAVVTEFRAKVRLFPETAKHKHENSPTDDTNLIKELTSTGGMTVRGER